MQVWTASLAFKKESMWKIIHSGRSHNLSSLLQSGISLNASSLYFRLRRLRSWVKRNQVLKMNWKVIVNYLIYTDLSRMEILGQLAWRPWFIQCESWHGRGEGWRVKARCCVLFLSWFSWLNGLKRLNQFLFLII